MKEYIYINLIENTSDVNKEYKLNFTMQYDKIKINKHQHFSVVNML